MKKFLKPLFSKKILGAVFFILQLLLIAFTLTGIYDAFFYVSGILTFLAVVVVIYELNRHADPSVKLVWIAIVAFVPLFGVFLYVYVHSDGIVYLLRKRLGFLSQKVYRASEFISADLNDLKEESLHEYNFFSYLKKNAPAPVFSLEDVSYFPLGEDMYASVLEDVKKAEKYIFIEMFIINTKDTMWTRLEEILIEKAKSGVDVRIIFDAMGSYGIADSTFIQRLKDAGIKSEIFAPLKPFLSSYQNNRNHHKIIIVDGNCAYTGGVNLADEYINQKVRFGHWKDTAIRVKGDAVCGFLFMFFKMWNLLSKQKDEYHKYLINSVSDQKGSGYICSFDDTPMDEEFVTKNVFMHIINSANDYVYINTPYLVLGDDLLSAITFAAKRGVDVKLCLPHIPDKKIAFAVARTYYPELIESGVSIYEYTPGFLHAKSTVSDDERVYIGSANYDFRSLYHNYECGSYIYKNKVALLVKEDYLATLEKCHCFTLEDYKSLNIFYRISGRIFRLFAPLL